MNKMRHPLYTQDRNECTLYTMLNILRAKYGIILNEDQRAKLVADAALSWLWSVEDWAVFRYIYNWFTGRFYAEFGIELDVDALSILGKEFEDRSLEWESRGIWLLYAWTWYREVREDWEITLDEVENSDIDKYNYFWHNLFWKLNYIVWIVKSIPYDKKYIMFQLAALKEAVHKWFFRETARTFTMNDKYLEHYLIELNKDVKYDDIEWLDERNRTALELARKLRWIYLQKS